MASHQAPEDFLRAVLYGPGGKLHVGMLSLAPTAFLALQSSFPWQVLNRDSRDVPGPYPVVQGFLADPQPLWPRLIRIKCFQYGIGAVSVLQNQDGYPLHQCVVPA